MKVGRNNGEQMEPPMAHWNKHQHGNEECRGWPDDGETRGRNTERGPDDSQRVVARGCQEQLQSGAQESKGLRANRVATRLSDFAHERSTLVAVGTNDQQSNLLMQSRQAERRQVLETGGACVDIFAMQRLSPRSLSGLPAPPHCVNRLRRSAQKPPTGGRFLQFLG